MSSSGLPSRSLSSSPPRPPRMPPDLGDYVDANWMESWDIPDPANGGVREFGARRPPVSAARYSRRARSRRGKTNQRYANSAAAKRAIAPAATALRMMTVPTR